MAEKWPFAVCFMTVHLRIVQPPPPFSAAAATKRSRSSVGSNCLKRLLTRVQGWKWGKKFVYTLAAAAADVGCHLNHFITALRGGGGGRCTHILHQQSLLGQWPVAEEKKTKQTSKYAKPPVSGVRWGAEKNGGSQLASKRISLLLILVSHLQRDNRKYIVILRHYILEGLDLCWWPDAAGWLPPSPLLLFG